MREDTIYSKIIDPQWYCDPPTDASKSGNCALLGTPEVETKWEV